MARKKFKKTYKYACTVTNQMFVRTTEAQNPEDLLSINAYYNLHPELDDRQEKIKILSKAALDEAITNAQLQADSVEMSSSEVTNNEDN